MSTFSMRGASVPQEETEANTLVTVFLILLMQARTARSTTPSQLSGIRTGTM